MHKLLKKILFLLFLIQILCFVFLLSPNTVNAGDSYTLKIPIGNFKSVDFNYTTRAIAEYIQAIYKYAIGIVAILATVVMMVSGIVWMTAGGNQGRIGEAKQWITGALTGLVLTLCSFMILQTVNPDLVTFKPVGIARVDKIITGCCEKNNANLGILTKIKCDEQSGNWGGADSVWRISPPSCISQETLATEYINQSECTGNIIASTIGGSDPAIQNVECPNKCFPSSVNYSKSFWYGENDEIYCCICDICDGSNNGVECAENKTCQNGICLSCELEGDWCDPGDCCAGLFCNEDLFPDKCEKK